MEEKIASMIGDNRLFEEPIEEYKEIVRPPQPTPRNIERLSNGNLTFNLNQVETPKPTPVQSPVNSPRVGRKPVTPVLTPQNSMVEEARLPEPRIVPQVVEFDDETETLIETASDEENEGLSNYS